MSSKKYDGPSEGTRRSSRVVAKAGASSGSKPAASTKKVPAASAKTSKKRSKAEVESDDEEEKDDEAEEKPKAKKAKTAPKAKASSTKKDEESPAATTGLEIGSTISETTLKNEKDEDVNVKELTEKGLVLFVVPKADTPGCNNQACSFRDSYAEFTKEGYVVYGLSADKPTAQAKWQTKKELPYPLLSDPSRAFISAIGAGSATKTTRSHFVFEKGSGKLIDKKVPVQANKSSQLALEFLQGLKSKGAEE